MNPAQWERIEALLQQALDLEPQARQAFLETACAAEPELRREVETLLGNEERARSFIETPAFAYFAERRAAPSADSLVGGRISHYRIESLVGTGGMGDVYKARDENLPRTVAIKMLDAEFTADRSRERRFKQEAFAVSKLNHPNIITLFEIIDTDSAHFIVSEYVEGRTLGQLLNDPATGKHQRLATRQAIDIAIQVAGALKAAHTAWIIHRDIKPDNIMVRDDGLVKVLDFGIAKLGDEDEPGWGDAARKRPGDIEAPLAAPPSRLRAPSSSRPVAAAFTLPGTVMGTASYMSPEQARGETLDGRTDLFSLGVVLYEMVTGKRPWTGANEVEASASPRAETAPPHRFEHVPKELERIIRKAMRRDRNERYASAGEMLNELESLKRRLENRASRRIARLSALALLAFTLFAALATLASRGEVWDEHVLRDGHTAAVRRAAFSPDGRRLVSVGEDRQVIVWDFARRERLATFNDHTDWIAAVAFSPNGRWFATASYDRTVIVWDAVGLRKVAVLGGHPDKVVAVAFSPDSQVLVTVVGPTRQENNATFLWHVGSWQQYARIPLGGIDTQSPLFTEGGRRLVFHITTSPSTLPNTWDVKTGRPLGDQFDHAWDCQNAALSPDGTRLVGVTGSGEVIFADFKRRRFHSCDPVHQDSGRATAFSPDGRLVATCAENVILWDAVTRRKITTIDYPSIVWSVTFSPDGRWLVTTHGDGAIRVWDVVERQRAVGFNEHEGAVRAVAWAHDGKRFASAGEDRVVMVWNAETGRREMLLAGHTTRVSGLAFLPDGKQLASVDLDGMIIIWDLEQQRERLRFKHPSGNSVAYCLAVSPDGRLIVTSHGVYETANGHQVMDFPLTTLLNPSSIYGVAFSADGARLAVAHANGFQSVLDTTSWQIVEQTNLGPRQFISVSFAPSGKQMVTGEDGGSVQLWAAEPLRPIKVIGQHAARIKSVAFSPDGRQVVSAGDDKLIALWDASSGKLVTRIGLHTAPVYAVAFSPDGRRLISGGHDRSVRLYTRHRTLWGFRLD